MKLETLENKFDLVKQGAEKLAKESLTKRIDLLNQFHEHLEKRKDEFAQTISDEIGKPLWDSKQEVQSTIAKIAISIEAYKNRCQETFREQRSARIATRFKPLGIAAVIGPFNFPLHLPNGHIIPALIAGNTVLFKPSEKAQKTAELYYQTWLEATNEPTYLQVVQGGAETAEQLLTLPIDSVLFTGSLPVGLKILEKLASKPQILVALEMGGMNPLVVTEVSDLHAASFLTIQSAFITSGQRCTCARKLIVLEGPKGDAFLKELLHMISTLKVGLHTERPEPFMGEVISEASADHIFKAFNEQKGKPILKMERLGPRLLTPGIIEVNSFDIKDEEVFGPLLYLIRVKDLNEAIREANRTKYGLVAALFSDKVDEYEHFFYNVRAGVINWNTATTGASSMAPFGGIKMSGNYRPSASYATDYCSYPVASSEMAQVQIPLQIPPGLGVKK